MGQVFQRKYKAKDGRVGTCATWTIRYFRNGRAHQEPTTYTRKTDAQTLPRRREGRIADGVPVSAVAFRVSFDDAARDVTNDFAVNGKRSLDDVKGRIRNHLTPYFVGRRLSDISASDVRAHVSERQTAGAANGTINRELQILKRCFSLAKKAHKIYDCPDIPKLREAAPRAGFFETAQVSTVCQHLPAELAAVVRFGYLTGWRVESEVLPLEWRNVDFKAGEIRLDAGSTKNGDGRVFPMTRDLRALLEAQPAAYEQRKKAGQLMPRVFVRMVAKGRRGPKAPKPIRSLGEAWKAACRAVGCPGRIVHDLRRSAVRTFVRAAVPERVAMKLTGHKTRSVFERYNIVSDSDRELRCVGIVTGMS